MLPFFPLVVTLLFAVAPIPGSASADDPEIPPYEAREIEGALLEFDRGLPVVHVWGDPRERGERMGELLAPQIAYMVGPYLDNFIDSGRRHTAHALMQGFEATLPRYLYDEIRGIAEGADVDLEDVLLLNSFIDVFQIPACSAIGLAGTKTTSSRTLLARNLDWPALGGIEGHDLLLVIHPDDGPAVLSLTWPGLVGVLSGVNESGLCATMLVEPGKSSRQVGMPNMLAYRHLLHTRSTVEEVPGFFDENLVIAPNNMALTDAQGGLLAMEIDPWFQGATPRGPEEDILIVTDMIKPHDIPAFEDFRYNAMWRRMRSKERYSFLDLRAELQNVAPAPDSTPRENMQAMIFEPESGVVYLSMKSIPAAEGKYLRFSWEKLFNREPPQDSESVE